jgi:hypothetical protein
MEVIIKFDPEIKPYKGRKIYVPLLVYKSGYIYINICRSFQNLYDVRNKVKYEAKGKGKAIPLQAQKVPGV